MEKRFIMTAFGVDRPGIVADVTEELYEYGCNLEDTTMTSMLDEFALVLLFSGKGDGADILQAGTSMLVIYIHGGSTHPNPARRSILWKSGFKFLKGYPWRNLRKESQPWVKS